MRIEMEGFIEQQPTYTHVGYTAAALQSVAIAPRNYAPDPGQWIIGPSLISASLLCLILATVSWRQLRHRGALRWIAAIGALLAASALMAGALRVRELKPPIGDLTDEFVTTLYRLEKLCAETEAFAEGTGRYPSEDEWHTMFTSEDARDGWGHPFRYGLGHPDWAEGPPEVLPPGGEQARDRYVIGSMAEARGDWHLRSIFSWYLGDDGVYGTPDDSEFLKYIFEKVKIDARAYPHGRTPRKG